MTPAVVADRVLLRADRALDPLRLRTLPLQLGEGATRLLLAVLCVGAFLLLLLPATPPTFPNRVVFAPGLGWVDANGVPGLSPAVEDGTFLTWAVRGEGQAAPPARPAASASVVPPDEAVPHALAVGVRLSLNEATLAELESLPGVGPVLAGRIVAARPFRSLADLDQVSGVGPKSYARLAPLVQP